MTGILPKRWIARRPVNWDARINAICSEIHASAKPMRLFFPTGRSRSKSQQSGRLAGGTRKVMAFVERALPRLS